MKLPVHFGKLGKPQDGLVDARRRRLVFFLPLGVGGGGGGCGYISHSLSVMLMRRREELLWPAASRREEAFGLQPHSCSAKLSLYNCVVLGVHQLNHLEVFKFAKMNSNFIYSNRNHLMNLMSPPPCPPLFDEILLENVQNN
jgi:hypothetical protein